jgi:hypothetical protein
MRGPMSMHAYDAALRWAADQGHADVVALLKDWIEEHG